MITKLRRKMILMVMSVVTVLLAAVFLILYHSAASGFETRSMEALQSALQQEQTLPEKPEAGDMTENSQALEPGRPGGVPVPGDTRKADTPDQKPDTAGSAQETDAAQPTPARRTFAPPEGREERPILVLKEYSDGTVSILKNTLYTSETLDTGSLLTLAEESGKEFGKLPEEHLRFLKGHTAPDGSIRFAFGDTYSEEQSLKRQITASLLIGAGAFLSFLVFAVWFSGWAVKPVEEAWKRQRQFAADASHELKTPLTVILSNAGLIAASPELTDQEDKRRVGYIQAEAGRMKQLVEELLFLARSDAGRLAAEKTTVDLSFLVESCALTFEPVAFDQGKQIETDVEPDLILDGEEQKLKQLTEILLDNACKYSEPGSTIRVSLNRAAEKKIRFTVANQGTPLTKEEQKQIFERFYRADPSRGKTSGYGLGLAIAQEIVRMHGGKIWAESDGIKENRFTVEF